MDFGAALTYFFRDPRWARKFLLAGLISLIPVFGHLVVLGWAMHVARGVIEQLEQPVAELDLAEDFLRGLKIWGLNLIYALPGLVIGFPLSLGAGVMLASAGDQSRFAAFALFFLCLSIVLVFYGVFLALLLPAAYGNLLAHGEQFSAGLDVKEVLGLIRHGPVAYFLVLIGGMMSAFITLFGLAGCLIGVVFSGTFAQIVMAYLIGQAYREAAGLALHAYENG